MSESDKKSLQQSLREAWMSALGHLTTAEGEVGRAAQRILDALGLSPAADPAAAGGAEEAPEGAATEGAPEPGGLMPELLRRLRRNQEHLERKVDEAVKAAVARVRQPLADEVGVLKARLEALQHRVEAHRLRRRDGAPAAGDGRGDGSGPADGHTAADKQKTPIDAG